MHNGGDILGAVVADLGSQSLRIGFAGEDYPRTLVSTMTGVIRNTGAERVPLDGSRAPREGLEVCPPVVLDGLVQDWDGLERLWEQAMLRHLKADLRETPVLMAEKPYNSPKSRQRMAELMFEKYNVPAFFLSKDVVLSCFACGRTSGLVVDAGASGTLVVPVVDGWADIKGLNRSVVGGRFMDAYLLQILRRQGIVPRPNYRIKKSVAADNSVTVQDIPLSNINSPFDAWALLEIGRELKEAVCRTSDSPLGAEGDGSSGGGAKMSANIPLLPYELPDGTHLDIGNERFQPSELFFDTSPLDVNDPYLNLLGLNTLENIKSGRTSVFASLDSLPRLMCDSVLRAENQDAQASLCGNIVLSGGVSCLDGTAERVKTELERVLHPTMPQWKVKTISTGESERAICTWLGGSILASLGSFHEMWLSRQEYDEYGPNYVDRKCP